MQSSLALLQWYLAALLMQGGVLSLGNPYFEYARHEALANWRPTEDVGNL